MALRLLLCFFCMALPCCTIMVGGERGYSYANLGGNAQNINIQKQRASISAQDNVSGLAGVKEAISDAASAYTIGKALDAGKKLIDETADVIKDD